MSKMLLHSNLLELENIYPTNSKNIIKNISHITSPKKDSGYNLSNDSFDKLYCFNLIITTKDNNKKSEFSCYNTKEYANLIKTTHKIEFDNLDKYEISVNYDNDIFNLSGEINNNMSYYTEKNDNLFIEFSQDAFGHTDCTCYFLKKNIDFLCITPPN
jgi:hypothetical protein